MDFYTNKDSVLKINLIEVFWGLIFFGYFIFFYYFGRFEGAREIPTRVITPILLLSSFLFIQGKGVSSLNEFKVCLLFICYCGLSGLWVTSLSTYLRQMQMLLGLLAFYQIFYIFQYKFNVYRFCLYGIAFGSILLFLKGFEISDTSIIDAYSELTANNTFRSAEDNANTLGSIYLIGISSFLLLNKSFKRTIFIYISFIPVVMLFYGIVLTASRSNLLCSGLLIVVDLFYNEKFNNKAKLLLGFLLFYVIANYYSEFLSSSAAGERFTATGETQSDISRSLMIKESIELFLGNPLVGIGLGNVVTLTSLSLYAHNDFIEIAASLGIIGLLLYLKLLISYFNTFVSYFKVDKIFAKGVLTFFFVYLILGLFTVNFTDTFMQMYLIMNVIYIRNKISIQQ